MTRQSAEQQFHTMNKLLKSAAELPAAELNLAGGMFFSAFSFVAYGSVSTLPLLS